MGGEETQEPILHPIRVLVLVDQHVAESACGVGLGPLRALEELDPFEQQVVEVDSARGFELPLIALRRQNDIGVEKPGFAAGEGLILRGGDGCGHAGERVVALRESGFATNLPQERPALVLPVNGERRG